jgi:hypothetical protein
LRIEISQSAQSADERAFRAMHPRTSFRLIVSKLQICTAVHHIGNVRFPPKDAICRMSAVDPFLPLAAGHCRDKNRMRCSRWGDLEMSGIEFMLGLFGLLIGFILLEVMSGLMRTLRARLPSGPGAKAEVHIGWLTPLLGAYTMLNVLLCWVTVFGYQEILPFGFDTLTIGLVLCAFYYFAASMIFPGDPRSWPDIDEWFWLHRRQALACILAANIPWFLSPYFVERLTFSETVVTTVVVVLQVGLALLAMLARKQWMVAMALAALVALHLSFVPLDYLHRHHVW